MGRLNSELTHVDARGPIELACDAGNSIGLESLGISPGSRSKCYHDEVSQYSCTGTEPTRWYCNVGRPEPPHCTTQQEMKRKI